MLCNGTPSSTADVDHLKPVLISFLELYFIHGNQSIGLSSIGVVFSFFVVNLLLIEFDAYGEFY